MKQHHFLRGARVYLSGPMDFVASRADEKKLGWRNRIGDFLHAHGAIVFDPWLKPGVRGAQKYGLEDINTIDVREEWTFTQDQAGDEKRSRCADKFWETLHIDLRMVDTSDFTIAFVPTNIYSVGTVHEIVLSRLQRKPVLFVSPPVSFPALELLRVHLEQRKDLHALQLLDRLEAEVPIKPNPRGIPSLWYMPLIGSGNFFDGFGFADYREKFRWEEISMDERERLQPPQNPLLPFLERLTQELPRRWDNRLKKYVPNDDWLLWELEEPGPGGNAVQGTHKSGEPAE
ncbi:MAG: hypothetical protein ABI540_10845 [Spartobacteria bacterium]